MQFTFLKKLDVLASLEKSVELESAGSHSQASVRWRRHKQLPCAPCRSLVPHLIQMTRLIPAGLFNLLSNSSIKYYSSDCAFFQLKEILLPHRRPSKGTPDGAPTQAGLLKQPGDLCIPSPLIPFNRSKDLSSLHAIIP